MIEMKYQEVSKEFQEIVSKLKFGNLSPEQLEDLEVRAYGDVCLMIEVA